jgi:hypothetical protein
MNGKPHHNTKHGHASKMRGVTPEYRAWLSARARCEKPDHPAYKYYGARGIRMSPYWTRSFTAFLADMGRKPSPLHSLDRITNDGHYVRSNTRWATKQEQSRNRRNAMSITLMGRTGCLKEWCEWMKLPYGRVKMRISQGGKSPAEALGLA